MPLDCENVGYNVFCLFVKIVENNTRITGLTRDLLTLFNSVHIESRLLHQAYIGPYSQVEQISV